MNDADFDELNEQIRRIDIANATFELCEHRTFAGSIAWRLKGNSLQFEHTDYKQVITKLRPLVIRKNQIASFVAALNFLDVWNWNPNYRDSNSRDGMSWKFQCSIDGRTCCTSGINAFPSFADPKVESVLGIERYGFLYLSLGYAFGVDLKDYVAYHGRS
jgi:hypothetical protein